MSRVLEKVITIAQFADSTKVTDKKVKQSDCFILRKHIRQRNIRFLFLHLEMYLAIIGTLRE